MSSVTEDDVRSLARLSRLALGDEEIRELRADLSSILEHMDALREVDVEGVEPMTHPMPSQQPLRADVAMPSLERERVLRGSARSDGESFIVPSILPGDES